MYEEYQYLTQTQLGHISGLTSHEIGKELRKLGLRTKSNTPTKKAVDEGYAKHTTCHQGSTSFWAWHRIKTLSALASAGFHPVKQDDKTPAAEDGGGRLTGPFELRQSSTNGFEIISSDGTVSVWVVGHRTAHFIHGMLNLAYKYGVVA